MAQPVDPSAQGGHHPQMMMHAAANWVPPPGWVAPPGWAEYQAFLQAQQRASVHYQQYPAGYPQQPGQYPMQVSQHGAAVAGPLPSPRNTHVPQQFSSQSPNGTAIPAPLPSPRNTHVSQQYAAHPQQFVNPQHYAAPQQFAGHPQQTPQQAAAYAAQYAAYTQQIQAGGVYSHPGQQYPTQYPAGYTSPASPHGVSAVHRQSLPTPEVLPANYQHSAHHHPVTHHPHHPQQQQQHNGARPPPPPEPAHVQRPPRVKVQFDDADSDDEALARHDTLGHIDMEDVHELDERDFAELDTGTESNVQDAGIIEGGIAVQPAIPLKDTQSQASTLPTVESFIVPVQPRRVSGIMPAPSATVATNISDETVNTTAGDAPKPAESPTDPAPPPVTPEKSPSRRNSESGGLGRRKSTFSAVLLGAAAAMFGGSSKKLASRQASMANASDASSAAAAADASAAVATLSVSASISNQLPKVPSVAKAAEKAEDDSLPEPPQLKTPPSSSPTPEPVPNTIEQASSEAPALEITTDSEGASARALEAAAPSTAEVETVASTPKAESVPDDKPSPAVPAPAPPFAPSPSPGGFLGPVVNQEADDSEVVSIKVRTLAGKAAIFEVDKLMSLFELRTLIQEHFNNIPFEEQRLLYKGKMIEILDPSTTLEEIGFKDNDLVHLVRTLQGGGGASAQQQQTSAAAVPAAAGASPGAVVANGTNPRVGATVSTPPPASAGAAAPIQQNLQMLTVLVPPGRGPGDRLRILPQGRGAMLVTVPAGVFAGDRFRVLLPPEDPTEMARAEALLQQEQVRQQEYVRQQELQRQQQLAQQQLAQQQQNNRPQIMAVVVPKGFKAGQMMDVNVPGKGRVRVTIPNGVKAGQQFKFRLPN